MPENPNLNSVRMQRAQRINNIEEARLNTRVYLMDKEKRHLMRVAQQDMRMVNLTLDYIQSSSGYSPEALPPDYVEPVVEKEPEACFMYGERLRRWKKSRRVQSAPSHSRRQKEEGDVEKAGTSSQAKSLADSQKKGWGSACLPLERIREQSIVGNGEDGKTFTVKATIRPKTSIPREVPREGFVTEISDNKVTVPQITTEMSEDTLKAMQGELLKNLESAREEFQAVKKERKQIAHGRKAAITQAVNKVRVLATSARRMRNVTPMQALVKPPTKTLKQREAWEEKISVNTERKQRLEAKLRIFMTNHPVNRSISSSIEV